jgi:hypothetical protein
LKEIFSLGEILLDWLLIHFESHCENITLIKQVILQCCTCLIGLDVLRIENNSDHDLFQVGKGFFSSIIFFCLGRKRVVVGFSHLSFFFSKTQGK